MGDRGGRPTRPACLQPTKAASIVNFICSTYFSSLSGFSDASTTVLVYGRTGTSLLLGGCRLEWPWHGRMVHVAYLVVFSTSNIMMFTGANAGMWDKYMG